ncbi:hypothetical protein [uncultured Imperialibacter sp.]|uniref:hypothetical protein n=1 Tax=uncultured Imperialibacter sp. TaxID=1672639 RepID=UPI0030D7D370|tara:strand:- start:15183 stop:15947 length:765 start_codon:yes stop_codon:yes gene_type:complete
MSKIYDFLKGPTADWLEEKLYRKLKEGSVYQYKHVENIVWNRIKIKNDRFVYDDGENEAYMFAYKNRYATIHWNDLPRFHIEECQTREQYSNYVFASSMPVKVFCTDQNKSIGEQRLKFCRNCNRKLNFFSYGEPNKNWFDVIIEIAEKRTRNNEYDETSVRQDGYSKDWNQVSFARRAQEDFSCERCGILLEFNNANFLEVHHKDRNRLNNKASNLEVLCTECHANVDAHHQQIFSKGKNHLKLQSFKAKFRH